MSTGASDTAPTRPPQASPSGKLAGYNWTAGVTLSIPGIEGEQGRSIDQALSQVRSQESRLTRPTRPWL